MKDKLITLTEFWNSEEELSIHCDTEEQAKKLLKAFDILKNKKVNLFHIWVFDDYEQYKEHYPFSEYHAEEDMLTEKEFNFLKEVFEYDK